MVLVFDEMKEREDLISIHVYSNVNVRQKIIMSLQW